MAVQSVVFFTTGWSRTVYCVVETEYTRFRRGCVLGFCKARPDRGQAWKICTQWAAPAPST